MAELIGNSGTDEEVESLESTDKKFCHKARQLTQEEIAKLEKDKSVASEFKQRKLELEAQKNWDLFYKRNSTKFFKDRHWTKREFDDLACIDDTTKKKIILEVGCGVGNFIWPLLEEEENLFFYACDFSKRAVQFVKEHKDYDPTRCCAFQCDLTKDNLTLEIQPDSVDVVSMIFVLSAIHPDKMVAALTNIFKVIRPGGCILFRDYGLYDYAMLRFAPGHKLSENFYVRQDGTRAYYFSLEMLETLMYEAGFDKSCSNCDYVQRETVNKKEGLCVPRIFVQGKFVKPSYFSKEKDLCVHVTEQQGECDCAIKNKMFIENETVSQNYDGIKSDSYAGGDKHDKFELEDTDNSDKSVSDKTEGLELRNDKTDWTEPTKQKIGDKR